MTRKRKWMLGVGLAAASGLAAIGLYAATHLTESKAIYAARQLRHAATDDDRAKAANDLAALGEPGLKRLVGFATSDDDAQRAAAVGAIEQSLGEIQSGDPRAGTIGSQLLDRFGGCDEKGKRAILALLPSVLAKAGATHAAKCQEAASVGLRMSDPAGRVLAIRLAIHPEVNLRREVVPLLAAAEPEVRRAALFAVATSSERELVSDEELFRWLHDPDEGVRRVCLDALVARERTDAEIMLGRRLTSPDPGERLKLILDLRYDDDVADPEPWLERLSRDDEPAVRAAAA
ncbi:MAG TPA: hypothetical protein VLM40_04145, partial [Gemmata sp.]|nr:hypothetical protein [Gemmata sp.]